MLAHSFLAVAAVVLAGQNPDDRPRDGFQAPASWRELGPSIWFDPEAKELVIRARVCLREGFLEHLLCAEHSKEHESILATKAPARMIHAGLLLTGAEPGRHVVFQPKFEPPRGTPIEIKLEWTQDGKARTAKAREWVMDEKSKQALGVDWVFAGSYFHEDPGARERIYAATFGDLFTVANFPEAILDLPISSPESDELRTFVARTEVIPPLGTAVMMRLKPRAAVKGEEAAPAPAPEPGG